MAMREKGSDRWRGEYEPASGGTGSRNDVSDYGRSSEYGANFRDSSMYGGDRSQQGRFGGNEHYQGNDAGVPYQANRYGQEDGGWSSGGERYGYGRSGSEGRYGSDNRYGFDQNRYGSENRYGFDQNRYGSENRYGVEQNRYGSDQNRYGSDQSRAFYGRERSMSDNRYGGDYGIRSMRDYGGTFGSEYGNRMSSSIPDYDSSIYGIGQSYANRSGMSSWRQGGQHDYGMRDRWQAEGREDESMLQKVGHFFGIGPKGYKRSDSRIQEDVNDALMDDPFVDATHIEVNVKDGEVTLEGFVEDRTTKRRAEDVVANVRGVKDCHNHLRIRPLSQANIGSALQSDTGASGSVSQTDRKDRTRHNSVS